MNITWEDRKTRGKIDDEHLSEKPVFSFTYAWFLVNDETAQYVESHDIGVYNKDLPDDHKQEIINFYNNYQPPVVVPHVTTLPEKIESKSLEIKTKAETERNEGFTSSALGTEHEYGSTLEDRINLIGANQSGQPTDYNVKESGQRKRKSHNPAQLNQVLSDGFAKLQTINSKESTLLDQIESATTIEELDLINW